MRRVYAFLLEKDVAAARKSIVVIRQAFDALKLFPYSCRKVMQNDPSLRELIIPFGGAGYVAMFRIRGEAITILAIRHQYWEDYL